MFRVRAVSVVGVGYVGLVLAGCLASRGIRCYVTDKDEARLEAVRGGRASFYEPRLDGLLRRGLKRGALHVVDGTEDVVKKSDVTFIAVGTPSGEGGAVDSSYVKAASGDVGSALAGKGKWHVVVVKSTVIPGTTGGLVRGAVESASGLRCGDGFGLCMNPEFLQEGSAVENMFHPDRVVVGEFDCRSGDALCWLYRRFYGRRLSPILRMGLSSAEMVKYASNAFLAAKVSYINEVAGICEGTVGVDVGDVAEGMGYDRRIGRRFLNAGLGFGGSCFPKDVKAFVAYARGRGLEPMLMRGVLEVNERQAVHGVELAERLVGDLKGKHVALLGLSFKPETSDIREAASLKIIDQLLRLEAEVVVYDPAAMGEVKTLYGDRILYAGSALDCLKGANCCIVVTEWEEFRRLKAVDFKRKMRAGAVVVDGRRVFNPEAFAGKVRYVAVGRG